MNILSVCNFGYYQYYSSSFVHNQAKAFVKNGDRVRILVLTPIGKFGASRRFSPASMKMTVDGVEIVYLHFLSLSTYGNKHFNFNSQCLFYRINKNRILSGFIPDVIHVHTIGMTKFADKVGLHELAPIVVTAHGSDVNVPFLNGNLESIKKSCDLSDAVITVSSALEKKIKQTNTKTFVKTVLNGFETENVLCNNNLITGNWIQVGNLKESKHVETTLKAFERFLKKYPGRTLTVIGEGPEKQRLQNLVDELGITDSVYFKGQKDNKDVLKEMSEATFFVMISSPEGLGIVYLEAMKSNCITIGTEGEGIADVIINGENGFLVPLGDYNKVADIAISCMDNLDRTTTLLNRATESVANISWESNIQQVKDIFSKTIKNTHG